ncbi:MAG: dethiobiotin synthase, partial [Massilia sp.]
MNNLNETDAPVIAQPALDPEVDLTEFDEPVLEPELELRADDLPMRFACFVTGTDTEIGKTLISAAILHKLVATGQRAC